MTAVEKIAERLIKKYDLMAADDISRLSDADILRTAGVGRKSLQAIRIRYPFNYEQEAIKLKNQLRKKENENKKILERFIDLGSVHRVNAVRFAPKGQAVVIQTSEHDQLFPIHIVWSPYVDRPIDFASFGFGKINENFVIAMGVALPALILVESVWLEDPETFDDFIAYSLKLRTGEARFKVKLFCDR